MWKKLTVILMVLSMLLGMTALADMTTPSLSGEECISPAGSPIIVTAVESLVTEVANALHGIAPTNQNTEEENSTILALLDKLLSMSARGAARYLDVEEQLAAVIDIDRATIVTGGSQRLSVPKGTTATVEMNVKRIADAESVAVILVPYDRTLHAEAVAAELIGQRIRYQFVPKDDLYTIVIVKVVPDSGVTASEDKVEPMSSVQGQTMRAISWTGLKDEWIELTPYEELVVLVENAKNGIPPTNRNTAQENETILELLNSLMPKNVEEVAQAYQVTTRLETLLAPDRNVDHLAMVTGASLRVSSGLVNQRVSIAMKVAGIAEGDWAAVLLIPYADAAGAQLVPTYVGSADIEFSYVPETELYTLVVIKDVSALSEANH